MDIFSIVRSLWRHKWASIPVILLTVVGIVYVIAGRAPSYSSKAYVLLENPPTISQALNNESSLPSGYDPLASGYNPLASLENLVQVGDVLGQMVSTPAEEAKLVSEGAAPGYTVVADTSPETPPVLDITGVGSSPQQAIGSAQLVANDIQHQLYQLQQAQNVNYKFMITSVEYVKPATAAKSTSSSLRSALVILAAGLLLLLVAVSASQSIEERRRAARRTPRTPSSSDGPAAIQDREQQAESSSSAANGRRVPVSREATDFDSGLAYSPNSDGSSS